MITDFKKQMFITVEGGLIQHIDVTTDVVDVNIMVIDLDIDGAQENETTVLPSSDRALVDKFDAQEIGKDMVDYWNQILLRQGK